MFRIVALWCMFFWGSEFYNALQCNVPQKTIFEFSLNSGRNISGLWTTQVYLGGLAIDNETGTWDLTVKQMKCENSDQVTKVATIIVPDIGLVENTPTSEPKGYTLIPNFGYYKLHTEIKTWKEAFKTCEEEGTHLVIFNSEEEAKALGRLWDENPEISNYKEYAYAGFHQLYKRGEYLTIFNQSLSTVGYMKWGSNEPGGIRDNCGFVLRRLNLLGDINCNTELAFFCEKELQ